MTARKPAKAAKRAGVARVTKAGHTRRMNDEPMSLSERVRASEQRKVEAGGRRMPGGVMPADAAAALEMLQAAGYGSSATGCISRALVEAWEAMPPGDKRRARRAANK